MAALALVTELETTRRQLTATRRAITRWELSYQSLKDELAAARETIRQWEESDAAAKVLGPTMAELADELSVERKRLDWLLAHSHMSVHGSEERGWVVCDQSNGLTIAGLGKTGREAIDGAMKGKEKP